MLKQKNHRLLFPPRYARGDSRNDERIRVVSSLNRMVRLYDKIVFREKGVIVEGENNGTRRADSGIG